MTNLKSSNLESCDYDAAAKTLTVKFRNGTSYSYENVPPETHEGLCAAESPGKYFNMNVRKHFAGVKLGQDSNG